MRVGLNTASLASTTRDKKEARMMSTVTFLEQFSSNTGKLESGGERCFRVVVQLTEMKPLEITLP